MPMKRRMKRPDRNRSRFSLFAGTVAKGQQRELEREDGQTAATYREETVRAYLDPIKKCAKLKQVDLPGITGPEWSEIVDLQWELPDCHVVRGKEAQPTRHHAACPDARRIQFAP